MNENQTNRIWRPSVEPNEQILPSPGSAGNHLQYQQVYTKTSLIKTDESSSSNSANWRNLNQEILSASQAFNNSPKPFYRQGATRPSCTSPSFGGNTFHLGASSSGSVCKHQPELESGRQVAANRSTFDSQSVNNNNNSANVTQQPTRISEEENMAPKLVHKQYNSPIDLYSMNNIRKTIEAHTELIAPGVKGINFMKADTPVNKQSEVYKLVMEEENQHSRGPSGASSTPQRLSPISGQPLNLPRALFDQQGATEVRQAAQHQMSQSASAGIKSNLASQVKEQQNTALEEQFVRQQEREHAKGPDKMPTCCECGQYIVGPFAKIQNRCVHPQCFNCTTCGTSLKNTGYFTVNEKLYCDIHAKQVANIMHIKYDFGGRQQVQHEQKQHVGVCSTAQAGQTTEVQQSNVKLDHKMHLQPLTSHTMTTTRQTYSSSTSPATISTMFADRSQSQNTGSGGIDTTWSWRPAGRSDLQQSDTVASTSSSAMTTKIDSSTSNYYSQQDATSSQQHSPTPTKNGSFQQERQQQQLVSMGTRGRGLLQEGTVMAGGRLPVCVSCHVQIHGPYILAGRTTWCKHCSQTNFNCSSCRRSLLDTGFIEDNSCKYYCEHCFEAYYAPICSKCNIRIKGDCLNALSKQWHPSCFVCGHCRRPFGNSSFYLEDNVPYCERDWSALFTTKCYNCSYPIQAGDKWIEALERNYHANCFKCSSCQTNLEGSTFYSKNGKPYCRLHAR